MPAETLTGYWWEPEKPDRKIFGTLDVSDDGSMALELAGLVPTRKVVEIGGPLGVVFGELRDGRKVTLADAVGGFPSGFKGTIWSTVLPELALVGDDHVADPTESPSFNSVVAQIQGFEDVVGGILFETDDADSAVRGSLRYAAEPVVRIDLANGGTVLIAAHVDRAYEGTTKTLTTVVTVEAVPASAGTFRGNLGMVAGVRDFVTFALAQPASFRAIELRTPEGSRLRPIFRPEPSPVDTLDLGRRLLPEIPSNRLGEVLPAWYAASRGDLRHVVNRHLSTFYRGHIYGETRFELAVQSIEGLHRTAYPDEVREPPEIFEARCARILGVAESASDRKFLKRQLRWANELSLAERLRAIMKRLPVVAELLEVDKKRFPDRVAQIRNDLAHGKPGSPEAELDPYELRALAETCRTYVNVFLLSELRFADLEVRTAIRMDRGASLAASWWAKRSRE
jgi:Apea-like HEPN/ApeA N-terminal domain 1